MSELTSKDIPQRRIVGALFIAQSLFSAATIVSFTLTSIIAADLSGSSTAAGLPSTITLASRAFLAYPIGWLLDRWGRRLGLSLGYLAGVAGSIVAALSILNGSFAGFLFGAALFGGSRAAAEQSRYVAAEVFPAGRQAKVIGLVVFAGTAGAIGGPLLVQPSGYLAESLGLLFNAGPFVLAGLLFLASTAVVYAFLRPDPLTISQQLATEQRAAQDKHTGDEPVRPLREIFGNPLAVLAVSSMTIGQIVMALLMVITPLHMNHHEHGTQSISLVIMAHTLGMFGLSGVTGWLIDRFGRLVIITTGSVILVTACLLAPVSTEVPLLAVALFLLGLGWNFCFVAGSSLLSSRLTAGERGRAQGAGEMAVAFGAAIGTMGSGLLFARGDLMAVSIVGLALSVTLLGMAAWVFVARRQAESLIIKTDA